MKRGLRELLTRLSMSPGRIPDPEDAAIVLRIWDELQKKMADLAEYAMKVLRPLGFRRPELEINSGFQKWKRAPARDAHLIGHPDWVPEPGTAMMAEWEPSTIGYYFQQLITKGNLTVEILYGHNKIEFSVTRGGDLMWDERIEAAGSSFDWAKAVKKIDTIGNMIDANSFPGRGGEDEGIKVHWKDSYRGEGRRLMEQGDLAADAAAAVDGPMDKFLAYWRSEKLRGQDWAENGGADNTDIEANLAEVISQTMVVTARNLGKLVLRPTISEIVLRETVKALIAYAYRVAFLYGARDGIQLRSRSGSYGPADVG